MHIPTVYSADHGRADVRFNGGERLMHLSMFSPRKGVAGLPRELDNFEKLGSNSLHNFVSKIP